MDEPPKRCDYRISVTIPTTDFRTNPNSSLGECYYIGSGIVHHDLVNIPFYGRVYDTGIIGHPVEPLRLLYPSETEVAAYTDHVLSVA